MDRQGGEREGAGRATWNNKGTQLRRCMLTSDLTVNM